VIGRAKVTSVHPVTHDPPSRFAPVTPPPRRFRRLGALVAIAVLAPLVGWSAAAHAQPEDDSPPPPAPTQRASADAPGAVVPLRADTEPLDASTSGDAPDAPAAPALGALAADGNARVVTRTGVAPFVALGLSWRGLDAAIGVRVQMADGHWTDAVELHAEGADDADATASDDGRLYTDPFALGASATGYELTLPPGLADLDLHFIREVPGAPAPTLDRAELTPSGAADGIPGPDGVRSRASWGARERKYSGVCASGSHAEGLGCVADSGVVNAVVHHTVNSNTYSAESVPAMLRSIQAFHMDVRGWDDIGYNVVVDRFGTIWEARAGGFDRAVVGGHVAGFNTGSVGVSVLGTFDSSAPSAAALEGVARVIAWKFAQRNIDPLGSTVLVSRGGDIHPPGEQVPMANISGHRDLGQTGCPGQLLYARLPEIRQRVAELMPVVTGEVPDLDRTNGRLRLGGFALRRDSAAPVSVRLEIDGATVATAVANLTRSDMAGRWGGLGAEHGFTFDVPVTLDMRRACVFDEASGTLIGCRDANPVTRPFGDFSLAVGSTGPPRIDIGGWAIEPDDSASSPLHVYVDGSFATAIWTGVARPDVAAVYPRYGGNRGFAATLPSTLGPHVVCVYAINVPAGDHTLLGCRQVNVGRVDTAQPRGSLDVVRVEGPDVSIQGWALDDDSTAPIPVHIYVDGAMTSAITADVARPDLAQAFPGKGTAHGFATAQRIAPGGHDVCVYAINDNLVGPNTLLGCRHVDVPVPNLTAPAGSLDVAVDFLQLVVVAGWAADPDSGAAIPVHVYVDGAFHSVFADQRRDDVAAVFPSFGPDRGFVGVIGAAPGPHQVCVYAINDNLVGPHRQLGCRTVVVPQPNATPPIGSLDLLSVQAGTVHVAGWALDPDSAEPIPVHVYVGGVGVATTAAVTRPDLPAAMPGRGAEHGFDLTIPRGADARRVCVYAINDNPDAPHTTLGCRSI
jgi:hypothetical protein